MSDILSKLYHGNMQPSTSTQWHNEEFEKNRKEYMELEKELVDSLGKESTNSFSNSVNLVINSLPNNAR